MPVHRGRRLPLAVIAAGSLALAVPPLQASAALTSPGSGSPISLWAPAQRSVASFSGTIDGWGLGLRVIANGTAFELRSHRSSYSSPVTFTWKSPSGDVVLPSDPGNTIDSLGGFLKLELTRVGTDISYIRTSGVAIGSGERTQPAAEPHSPYPRYASYSPYAIGGVQGLPAGWAGYLGSEPVAVKPGRYRVVASITDKYADALGISRTDATRTMTVDVTRSSVEGFNPGMIGRQVRRSAVARAATQEPTGATAGAPAGPMPDLRSLPASWIQLGARRKYLSFGATVWNAGDSPLVVDGFRRAGEDLMDAYQYFFDSQGNQTGYRKVGGMEWDPRESHQHWHFKSFARYSLLDATKREVVRSKKEAFCLANTDAVDLTVPGANWNPDNTDLATACGDLGSLSVREVLAAGWGDTYSQVRAGQSFRVDNLPNGTYYIATIANPTGNLIESSTENNVSYRKIRLAGTKAHRRVVVPRVGLIDESRYFG